MANQRKLKVAHLVSLNVLGGVVRFYADFLSLSTDAFDHYTINDRDKVAPAIKDVIEKHSVECSSVKLYKGFRLPKKPKFLRLLNLKKILHDISPDLLLVWDKPAGIPSGVVPPDTSVIYYEHGAGWSSKKPSQVESFLRSTDAVICNSEAALQVLRQLWHLPESIPSYVCHNFISQKLMNRPVKGKQLDPRQPFRLGLAARLVNMKGAPIAIHAVKHLRDRKCAVELHLAGEGVEAVRLKRLAEELGVSEDVHFHGLVTKMEDFYSQIDCLLCPSLREAFGLAAIEAMACGCPVIGAGIDGLAEVIEEGVTGWRIHPTLTVSEYESLGGNKLGLPQRVYDPESKLLRPPHAIDPRVLADQIKSVMADRDTFLRVSLSAASRVREKFAPQKQVSRLVEVLERISVPIPVIVHSS